MPGQRFDRGKVTSYTHASRGLSFAPLQSDLDKRA